MLLTRLVLLASYHERLGQGLKRALRYIAWRESGRRNRIWIAIVHRIAVDAHLPLTGPIRLERCVERRRIESMESRCLNRRVA